jgi:serine/threonine protein phosphatase PrpC
MQIYLSEKLSDLNSYLQFGVFGICDGHGGVAAAKSASKLVFVFQY